MKYTKGQHIIYIDQWITPEAHDLYFLFHLSSSDDPDYVALAVFEEEQLSKINSYNEFNQLVASGKLTGNEALFIDSLEHVRPYNAKTFSRLQSITTFFREHSADISKYITEPWSYYESNIRKSNHQPWKFWFFYWRKVGFFYCRRIFSTLILPLVSLPFLDFYFLFLKFRERMILSSRIAEKEADIQNAKFLSHMTGSTVESIKKELSEEVESLKEQENRVWETLLQSSRSTITIIIAVSAVLISYFSAHRDEQKYKTQIQELQNRSEIHRAQEPVLRPDREDRRPHEPK
mgnify:CR=1 FL=1|tara:strand:- start:41 stop:913 length:873 start_codon:yes stop_codon:yes gene_type:complete